MPAGAQLNDVDGDLQAIDFDDGMFPKHAKQVDIDNLCR